MESDAWILDRILPLEATSVRLARELLRDVLAHWGNEASSSWLQDVQLAASELVTNALVHAGSEVRLRARLSEHTIRVEIADRSPAMPFRRHHSPSAGTGNGLLLVEEFTHAWGAEPTPDGKVVWFEVRGDRTENDTVAGASGCSRTASSETIVIRLLEFPLLIHAAWQEHATALLREYLLVQLERNDDNIVLFDQHAQASDALNLLYDQIPAPPFAGDAEQIMDRLTEPNMSMTLMRLRVPRASIPHFETLRALLADASSHATEGKALVPATQPEVDDLSQWICAEVRNQSSGRAHWRSWPSALSRHQSPSVAGPRHRRRPTPSKDTADPAPSLSRGDVASDESSTCLSDSVLPSPHAVVAMDERATITGVNRAALLLLRYSDREALRGQRVLKIIPPRYRQAHIAGMTLHMLHGRRPLLGRPVLVPALRADGTEVWVMMKVEDLVLPSGKRVFIAQLCAV